MIESLFFWFLIALTSIYGILHLFLFKGINRLLSPVSQQQHHSISIIVAARNEEVTIGKLLESLINQNYSLNSFEVIVVNDRSTDTTKDIVESFARYYPNIRLINIESNNSDMPHKKNALRSGITQASFEILAFIDADCIAPKNWLNEISNNYSNDVGVVAGYSPYNGEYVHSFLRYEEFKNSLIAASAVEINHAFMCTGRNFSYRKSLYHEVGGFEEIKKSISGDDDLFLQLVQKKTKWKIRYMIDPESYVRTVPPRSFSQFVNQRTRHVSASKYYPIEIKAAYSVIHIFHLATIIGFIFLPFFSLLAMLIKFNIDAMFIAKGKNIFHEEFSFSGFLTDEILMVFYSFFIAPLGFLKTFEWKGTAEQ